MLAVLTIVAVQVMFAALLFGTVLLDRPHHGPTAARAATPGAVSVADA
jgi:hypothetical protein